MLARVLAQSGQVFDSNGAPAFVESRVRRARERVPEPKVEARLDSAFFSGGMVALLEKLGVE